MRHQLFFLVAVLAATVLLSSHSTAHALPPPLVIFSVEGIDAGHDITPFANAGGNTCTSADLMFDLGGLPTGACAARVAPAPAGPVPSTLTFAPADLGLNIGGAFTDDLDALSWGELLDTGFVDFDFSVDPAPANGGETTAAGLSCAIPPSDVTLEAAALEAQGDIFTTAGAPVGCNVLATDESGSSLIAPNAGAPGVAPLDNLDALAELDSDGPCAPDTIGCAAFSVTAGSPVLPGITKDTRTALPANGGSILVPPGTPPNPHELPAGCPAAGPPCIAIHSRSLGLGPFGNDIDALCWFDVLDNDFPDLPPYATGGPGDLYLFSLSPGSIFVPLAPISASDILSPGPVTPTVEVPEGELGLLDGDNVDGLLCHQDDTDGDLAPDLLDNCAGPNPDQSDFDFDGADADGDGIRVDDDQAPFDGLAEGGNTCDPDDDNDAVLDGPDPCDAHFDPLGGPPPAYAIGEPADPDCDGFTSANESQIMTAHYRRCAVNSGQNNEGFPDHWPVDFNDNQFVNTVDVGTFVPRLGTVTASPNYDTRFDLTFNGIINTIDVGRFIPFFNQGCT